MPSNAFSVHQMIIFFVALFQHQYLHFIIKFDLTQFSATSIRYVRKALESEIYGRLFRSLTLNLSTKKNNGKPKAKLHKK